VDELVRSRVLLAPDVADRPAVELAERRHRLGEERLQPGMLDLVLPPIWRATSSESLMTSTSSAPSSRASRRPSRTARYSATLLVASPMYSPRSARTAPSSPFATAPIAAGPGLPRAPPSTFTTTRTGVSRAGRR